jgi:hypothetical protein
MAENEIDPDGTGAPACSRDPFGKGNHGFPERMIKGRHRTAEPEPGFPVSLQELLVCRNRLCPYAVRYATDTCRDPLNDFLAEIRYPRIRLLPCSKPVRIVHNRIPPATCSPPRFDHDGIFSGGYAAGNGDTHVFKKMLGIKFVQKTLDGSAGPPAGRKGNGEILCPGRGNEEIKPVAPAYPVYRIGKIGKILEFFPV